MKKSIEEKNSIGKIVAFGNWKIKKEKIVGVHMHVSPKNSKKKKNYSKLQNCRNGKIILRSENVRPKIAISKIPKKRTLFEIANWRKGKIIWHLRNVRPKIAISKFQGKEFKLLDKQRPTMENQTRTCDCPVGFLCALSNSTTRSEEETKRCGLRWQTVIFVNSCTVI